MDWQLGAVPRHADAVEHFFLSTCFGYVVAGTWASACCYGVCCSQGWLGWAFAAEGFAAGEVLGV